MFRLTTSRTTGVRTSSGGTRAGRVGSVVLGSLVALAGAVVPAHAEGPVFPPSPGQHAVEGGRLTVTVEGTGSAAHDGRTYTLECGPTGGDHPRAQAACDRLEQEGADPFAPVPAGAPCTLQYGGDATARVTGSWHGRVVNATYDRRNGCEISRWNAMEPVLPPANAG